MSIPENIIKKAVDIWCQKLDAPTEHDNGDFSDKGLFVKILSENLAAKTRGKIENDLPNRIEKFRNDLIERLRSYDRPYLYLDVDYHPCTILAESAKVAEIPESLFPIKSHVSFGEKAINISFGYGAPSIYYYPLKDDKWLVVALSGADIHKIIESAENGNPLNLKIE